MPPHDPIRSSQPSGRHAADPVDQPVGGVESSQRDPDGLGRAERLLTSTVRHADLTRTHDLVRRVSEDLATELGAQVAVRSHDEPPASGDATMSAPLVVRGHRVGSLDVTRPTPFDATERRLVGFLARQVGERLGFLSQEAELRVLAEMTAALATAESLEQGVRPALDVMLPYTGATAARLHLRRNDELVVLGEAGTWSTEPGAPETARHVAGECFATDQAMVIRDRLMACRLGDEPYRYVLLLQAPEAHGLLRLLLPSVLHGARAVTPHLEWLWREQVQDELLKFHGGSWDHSTDELYGRLLDTAIRLVHGADSGSLLVRSSGDEPFVYQAVRAGDAEAVLGIAAAQDTVRTWYGARDPGWERGHPRIIRSDETDIVALSRSAGPDPDPRAARTGRVRANVCLPVRRGGEVLAVLNLDNQRDPDAFGTDSLAIVDLFAAPLADILYRHQTQDLLRRAALTDPLTGLHNRRHLAGTLERELTRQRRDGAAVSVLVMDLADFKTINDASGHEAGDEALVAVGRALEIHVRDVDLVGRWGGDEFAAVLVDTPHREAEEVAARLREAVANLDLGPHRLEIDVGTATAPDDGTDERTLIAAADRRMYEGKRLRRTRR